MDLETYGHLVDAQTKRELIEGKEKYYDVDVYIDSSLRITVRAKSIAEARQNAVNEVPKLWKRHTPKHIKIFYNRFWTQAVQPTNQEEHIIIVMEHHQIDSVMVTTINHNTKKIFM